MKMKSIIKTILNIAVMLISMTATSVFAQGSGGGGGGGDITSMVQQVMQEATSIALLLNVAAYVAGVGFALAGILQFKAHKENPQQTPLSKPVVMIVVAACLLFLPTIMNLAGASLFGGGQQSSFSYTPPSSGQ
jgi:intracellular multiplication protein IcmD